MPQPMTAPWAAMIAGALLLAGLVAPVYQERWTHFGGNSAGVDRYAVIATYRSSTSGIRQRRVYYDKAEAARAKSRDHRPRRSVTVTATPPLAMLIASPGPLVGLLLLLAGLGLAPARVLGHSTALVLSASVATGLAMSARLLTNRTADWDLGIALQVLAAAFLIGQQRLAASRQGTTQMSSRLAASGAYGAGSALGLIVIAQALGGRGSLGPAILLGACAGLSLYLASLLTPPFRASTAPLLITAAAGMLLSVGNLLLIRWVGPAFGAEGMTWFAFSLLMHGCLGWLALQGALALGWIHPTSPPNP